MSALAGGGDGTVLITGGAGFVGSNLAGRLLASGVPVLLLDNLSRAHVAKNVQWLREQHGSNVELRVGDVRDAAAVASAVAHASHVFHFAAQVAVTTSLDSPVDDFDVNARGTLNVLEAIRKRADPPPLVFTSTNKVYGALHDLPLERAGNRYVAKGGIRGVTEERPLDFHSPYGCSKGTADQYVLDYARSYGLRTVVFRMSCIYGPHQFGTEDQGWVAHFLLRALNDETITIYGDGKQVRDVLYVEDLVDAFLLTRSRIDDLAGQAFNVGGGPTNSTSLLELVAAIGELRGRKPEIAFEEWRTGDQRWYVTDHAKLTRATGWAPKVKLREGLQGLFTWIHESRGRAARVAALGAAP